jgi:sigma-B regulation protein RsbU (phosphoserine phosphatase)
MSMVWDGVLRTQILDRRHKLQSAIAASPEAAHLVSLLQEVDTALERIDGGSYGLCEECGQPLEESRLITDPLTRVCLDCMSAEQQHLLEQDLGLAARIQNGLLPKPQQLRGWGVCYHYEPSSLVSGDYCDVVTAEDASGDPVFLLGDVSGKGVAAALLMSHMHAMFRTLIGIGMWLSDLMERANRVFAASTIATHYATLVCGRAGANGELEICNAGHCPPLLIRSGQATPVDATGLPIGIFSNATFSSRHFRLEPGDSIVLYSDGLTEAHDPENAEYGTERFTGLIGSIAHLPPGDLIGACLKDVADFRGQAPLRDDLTLMVVRRSLSNPT